MHRQKQTKVCFCKVCGQEFQRLRLHQKTCSDLCEVAMREEMKRKRLEYQEENKERANARKRESYRIRMESDPGARARLTKKSCEQMKERMKDPKYRKMWYKKVKEQNKRKKQLKLAS